MANIGIFDVLGPIMIGPSSSHTAGAARLGKIARTIVNKPIKNVTFLLHGSFKETYKGHGTDRALVAGILGMMPDDSRLRDSLSLAEKEGLGVNFLPADLGQVHPNTVKFLITDCDDINWEVLGSSIGGGLVEIYEINGNSKLSKRLYALGLIEGTEIELKRIAPLGDPLVVNLRGFDLAIRKKDAKNIILTA